MHSEKGLGLVIAVKDKYFLALVIAGILLSSSLISAEELREWKGTKGVVVKATFVNAKDGYVFLKLESGDVVQALIANLCKEDQAYIGKQTSEAHEIEVTYAFAVGGSYEESGDSADAFVRDTIQGGKTLWLIDSRWKSKSAQVGLSGSLYSRRKFLKITTIITMVHHQARPAPSWKG